MTDTSDTLAGCHARLSSILGPGAEPIEVLRRVEEYRQDWRPERVRVLLLAESHVYTTVDELARTVEIPGQCPPDMPRGFVRHVYCLGYGENGFLSRPIYTPKNAGCAWLWNVLYRCANASDDGFASFRAETPAAERVTNKLALLKRLRELGVWLLDASPAALYLPGRKKKKPPGMKRCLQLGWDHHVSHVVRQANPSRVICVGGNVEEALGDQLRKLHAEFVLQPIYLSSAEREEVFQKCGRIVREANGLASSGP